LTIHRPRICGLDEAGRGALAGPLVVAAVVLPADFTFSGAAPGLIVRDSKELNTRQRNALGAVITTVAAVDYATFPASTIDARGINWANTYGFRRLIRRLDADRYIVDGRWQLPPLGAKQARVECVIDADENVPAALAAGVMAKLYRDKIMLRLDRRHPPYGWATNTGHGTRAHIEAIRAFGLTSQHRRQFVATALNTKQPRRLVA
jgi:ribonuclease HII